MSRAYLLILVNGLWKEFSGSLFETPFLFSFTLSAKYCLSSCSFSSARGKFVFVWRGLWKHFYK